MMRVKKNKDSRRKIPFLVLLFKGENWGIYKYYQLYVDIKLKIIGENSTSE